MHVAPTPSRRSWRAYERLRQTRKVAERPQYCRSIDARATAPAQRVLVLCTGNAARSVIAGAALRRCLPALDVTTAGTFALDGRPLSWRTRAALEAVGLSAPRHRSMQATADHVHDADLVIGLAPEHVDWVRHTHRSAAPRTATLARLACQLAAHHGPLAARLGRMELAEARLAPWEEVADPGGGDLDTFVACAREVVALVDSLSGPLQDALAAAVLPRA